MVETLKRWAKDRGYLVGWGGLAAVAAALEDVSKRRRSGELDRGFYEANLAAFKAPDAAAWGRDASVVVVVMPLPAHTVAFAVDDGEFDTVFPPTYVRYEPLFEDVRLDLQEHALSGARVERLRIPLKALAARLGLVRYGRTNVTYAPGFGSYVQLFGYITDAALPLPADWRPLEPELLPECQDCQVCLAACPTGAIREDRVLLHGERCVTDVNERPGDWPDWLPASAHTCIIGCLECQRACPANPELRVASAGVRFTAEETKALLDGGDAHDGPAWDGIRAKLGRLGRSYDEPVLGRNLRALLETRRGGRPSVRSL